MQQFGQFKNFIFFGAVVQSRSYLTSRFTTLYEYRKVDKDWKNVLQDFLQLLHFCTIDSKSTNREMDPENRPFLDQLLHLWVHFKRDVDSKNPETNKNVLVIIPEFFS